MLKNKTKNTVIAKDFAKKGFIGKSVGLMGKKTPETLLFKTRFGIHTFFLKFPIDLIVLDKNKKIVVLEQNIKPNSVFFWNIKYDTVIELPFKALEKSKTQKGDILDY